MSVSTVVNTLVLAEFFLPQIGGSINWLIHTYGRYPKGTAVILAPQCANPDKTDGTLPFPVERLSGPMPPWAPTALSSWPGYYSAFRQITSVCTQYKIRQIHCAKVLPEGLFARMLGHFRSVPYLIYAHGEEVQICQTSKALSWLMPKVYNGASAIIANSTNTKEILEKAGVKKEKIHIIHPGVNVQDYVGQETRGFEIRKRHKLDGPVLLTVGRLQRRKGQDMVIKALPEVKKIFPSIHYLIVGGGEEETNLQNLAYECGVSDHVVFAGKIPDSELPAYYAACDVFVMPNRQIGEDIEGFGMVYLEAGAAGKPVIGGTSGGTRDAIVDGVTGFRVDGESLDELCLAIVKLLGDSQEAKDIGEKGRLRVFQEFTWEQVYCKTQNLLSALSL